MFRIHFLGTSAGCVTPEHGHSATAIETDEGLLLIDAGDGCYTSLVRQGLAPARIGAVLVSHWHSDHMLGLPAILAHLKNAEVRLPISRQTLGDVQAMYRASRWPAATHSDVKLDVLRVGDEIRLGRLSVQAGENCHIWPHLSLPVFQDIHREEIPGLSFVLNYQNLRVVYSGDLGTASEETLFWKLLEIPTDLLVLEAAHLLPLEGMIRRLRNQPIRHLVFNHIWREHLDIPEAQAYFGRELGIPVLFAEHDGDWVELLPSDAGPRMVVGGRQDLPNRLQWPRRYSEEEKEQLFVPKGIPTWWQILGPFTNPRQDGDYAGMFIDRGVGEDRDFSGTYVDAEGRRITWRRIGLGDIHHTGAVLFQHLYDGAEVVAYAATDVQISSAGRYRLLFGSDDGIRIWVDGAEVACVSKKRGAVPDEDQCEVELSAGVHRILLANDRRFGGWMFYFRIVPADPAVCRKS